MTDQPNTIAAGWGGERDHQLAVLVGEGLSGAKIGIIMGKSPSSIVGRCRRLGLQLKGKPDPLPKTPRAPRLRAKKALPADEPRPPRWTPPVRQHTGEAVPLVDLGVFECHWPLGEVMDRDFGFCGDPIHTAYGYCDKHRKIAFRNP